MLTHRRRHANSPPVGDGQNDSRDENISAGSTDIELLVDRMKVTKTNEAFFESMKRN